MAKSETETGASPEIENAERLYEAMRGAGFDEASFSDLGSKGQTGASFRALRPETVAALFRVVKAYQPVTASKKRSKNGPNKPAAPETAEAQESDEAGAA